MGNKQSSLPQTEKNQQDSNFKAQPKLQSKNSSVPIDIYSQSPSRLAQDQQGSLHPQWSTVVKQFQFQNQNSIQKYSQLIHLQTQQTVQKCYSKHQDNQEAIGSCLQKFQQHFLQIQQQSKKTLMSLGNIANKCLLKGNKVQKCTEEVRLKFVNSFEKSLQELVKFKERI